MINLINSVKKLIMQAGEIALAKKRLGLKIDKKIDQSVVTDADIEISDLIFTTLSKLYPLLPIICEERPLYQLNTDNFWLIDPIDGTRSYSKNKESYTINICLIENGSPKLGFIYQPELAKLYYTDHQGNLAVEQQGSIITSLNPVRSNMIAAVSSKNLNSMTKNFLEVNHIHEITSMASSIKFCLVADGTVDVYPRFDEIMEWDVGAGHALIKAIGGEVVDLDNKPLTYNKPFFKHPKFIAYGKKWLETANKKAANECI